VAAWRERVRVRAQRGLRGNSPKWRCPIAKAILTARGGGLHNDFSRKDDRGLGLLFFLTELGQDGIILQRRGIAD